MKRRLQFDPRANSSSGCHDVSTSDTFNTTMGDTRGKEETYDAIVKEPIVDTHKETDWTFDDVPTPVNDGFYPGVTMYENDVTTDEEDEDHKCEFGHLELFFHALGEPQLIPLFEKHRVTLGQLLDFDDKDLIDCGVELVGDRKKILENIAEWHSERWCPTSLNDMSGKKMLSAPGIYIALNDINKHIEYLGATCRYINRVIEKKPEILELGKAYCGIRRIASEIEDMTITHKNTGIYLQELKSKVGKHVNDTNLLPPNEIDRHYVMRAKFIRMKNKYGPISVVALSVLFGLGVAFKLHSHLVAKN